MVQVRWTDGLVYGAKFVAAHAVHMYLVSKQPGYLIISSALLNKDIAGELSEFAHYKLSPIFRLVYGLW